MSTLFLSCCNEKLNEVEIKWHNEKSLCIVLCAKGYPEKYKNNVEIENLEQVELNKNQFIFHAGTKINNSKIISNGGRVLNFVVKSNNFNQCRESAISLINQINWDNGFFRKDIGFKVID